MMSYLKNMSNVELACHYATCRNGDALAELEHRDRLALMTFDEKMALRLNESDNDQLEFAFVKDKKPVDNLVKDEWAEAYEAGYVAGRRSQVTEGG